MPHFAILSGMVGLADFFNTYGNICVCVFFLCTAHTGCKKGEGYGSRREVNLAVEKRDKSGMYFVSAVMR